MHRLFRSAVLVAAAISLSGPAASAQRRSAAPEAEDKTLKTKDGVEIAATYYPSERGKDATPVVMLHDLKESRAVFSGLAKRLQDPGEEDDHESFAVLAVDLRGHGDSLTQTLGSAGRSQTRQIDNSKLKKADVDAMVLRDMEAVRKFLVTENDAGRLNLNRLSVIGVGLGASVGLNWAAIDWSVKPLATVKQGQDVKAMVLVSPRWKTSGLSIQNAVRQPGVREQVAMMLLYGGKSRRHAADARRVFKQLERYHDDASSSPTTEQLASLLDIGPETELQGAEWLKQAGPKAEDLIIRFLTQHAAEPDFEHLKRRRE